MALKRIHKELADIKKEDLGGITIEPTDNLFLWNASIPGQEGSPYEGGLFRLEIHLPHDYPFSAPKILFLTRIYHMNISDRGAVCIDILKNQWSPALSIFKVILSLSSLLTDPNPQDPLVPSIATEYVRNRKQHDGNAKRWTELYAQPGASASPPPSSVGPIPIGTPSRLFTIPVLDAQRLLESIQSRSRSRTSSAPPSQPSTPSATETANDPILVESDSEENSSDGSSRSAPVNLKRKREEPRDDSSRQEKRARGEPESNAAGPSSNAGGVIVIEDDD